MEFVDSDGFIRGCLTTLEVVELRVLVIMPRCHVGTQSGLAIASRAQCPLYTQGGWEGGIYIGSSSGSGAILMHSIMPD